MQNSKGSGFLKVCGILMIIGGILTIVVSGILGIVGYCAGQMIANTGDYTSGEIVGVTLIIGAIIALIGGVLELIAGITGVKNHNNPAKANACLVWGIIVLVINVISTIFTLISGSNSVGATIISIVCGLALPVLFIIGAVLNKKSA